MGDDRHGRAGRADNDRRRRPSDGFRVRGLTRFERLTEDAIALLPGPIVDALKEADLVVEEVPPDPGPGEARIRLAEFTPATASRRARATIYRRPVEARASGRAELLELMRSAIGREVAAALGLDIDPDQW